MKKIYIYLIFPFFLFINNFVFSQVKLYIEFSSEKSVYAEQEPIIINFKLINNTGKKVSYIADCDNDIFNRFNLVDDKGIKYKYHGAMTSCIARIFILKAREILENEYPIYLGYGIDSSVLTGRAIYSSFMPVGKYTVSFNGRIGLNASAYSNTLAFSIDKPDINDGFDVLKSVLSIRDSSKKSDSLREFIYNYPQSAYMFIAFDEYLKLFPTFEQKNFNMTNVFKYFLSKRNNAWNVRKNVHDIANVINWLKGDERMISFLVYIVKKYPNSKAGFAAKEILQREIPNDFYIKNMLNE